MSLSLQLLARIDPNIFFPILTSRLISVIISCDDPESSVVVMVVVLLNTSLRNRFWPEAMSCVVPPPVSHCCVSSLCPRATSFSLGIWVFLSAFHAGQKVLNNSDFAAAMP